MPAIFLTKTQVKMLEEINLFMADYAKDFDEAPYRGWSDQLDALTKKLRLAPMRLFVTRGINAAKEELHGGQHLCGDCADSYRSGGPSGVELREAGREALCSQCGAGEVAWRELRLKFVAPSHLQEEDPYYEVVGTPGLTIQDCLVGGGFAVTQERSDGTFVFHQPSHPTLESAVKCCARLLNRTARKASK